MRRSLEIFRFVVGGGADALTGQIVGVHPDRSETVDELRDRDSSRPKLTRTNDGSKMSDHVRRGAEPSLWLAATRRYRIPSPTRVDRHYRASRTGTYGTLFLRCDGARLGSSLAADAPEGSICARG